MEIVFVLSFKLAHRREFSTLALSEVNTWVVQTCAGFLPLPCSAVHLTVSVLPCWGVGRFRVVLSHSHLVGLWDGCPQLWWVLQLLLSCAWGIGWSSSTVVSVVEEVSEDGPPISQIVPVYSREMGSLCWCCDLFLSATVLLHSQNRSFYAEFGYWNYWTNIKLSAEKATLTERMLSFS